MSLSKNWDLRIDPKVFKTVKELPRHDVEAILKVMRELPRNPYFGDIQKMRDEENSWRRRVGVYRIFYKILVDDDIVLVFKVERRTSKTY